MMKAYICKFFVEDNIEREMSRLISKVGKRVGINLRVFSLDEKLQKRLERAGISSELLNGFWRRLDNENEINFDKAYEISDRWHAAVEKNNKLKFHGINFLTLEYNMSLYSRISEFSELCHRLAKENCEILVLVVPSKISLFSPTINTAHVKTIIYAGYTRFLKRVWHLFSIAWNMASSAFRGFLLILKRTLEKPGEKALLDYKQRILFLVSSSLYARPAMVICSECLKQKITPFAGPYDPAVQHLLKPYNFEYLTSLTSSITTSVILQLVKIIPLFFKVRKFINSLEKKRGSGEVSTSYLCKEVLKKQLPQLFYMAINNIELIEKYISSVAPSLICLMPDGYFLQQMAAKVAKKLIIPTLACAAALEHGNSCAYMKHLHADKIAAMGQKIKDTYIASGLEPERAVVTGVAHFDLLFQRDKEKDRQTLLDKGIDPDKGIIMFATENLPVSETSRMLQGVIEAVMKLQDIQLVIKVHPQEEAKTYLEVVKPYQNPRIHVTKDLDLYALINICSFIIVKFSTVALEAMMIDKPVMVINLPGKPTPVPYAEEGAALGVYCYEDIEPAIMKMLYDEETCAKYKAGRYKFVRDWAGEPDGKASLRIVNLMKEMIAEARDKKKE